MIGTDLKKVSLAYEAGLYQCVIRLWRYKPTLLNKRPVQAQQDVTIEFRPPQLFVARAQSASIAQLAPV